MGFSKQLFSRNLGKDLLKAVTKNCKNHHHMTITLLYTHSHPSSVCPCHLRFKYSYFWRHFPDGQSRTKTGLWTTFSPSFTFPNFSRIECEHLHFSRTKINVILHYEIRYFSWRIKLKSRSKSKLSLILIISESYCFVFCWISLMMPHSFSKTFWPSSRNMISQNQNIDKFMSRPRNSF